MTSTPKDSDAPVPPYDGRKESAETETETTKDSAKTAGATAPVSDDEMKGPEPADTEGGATASPADEQPARETPDGESPERATGPAHTAGTDRGEDLSPQ